MLWVKSHIRHLRHVSTFQKLTVKGYRSNYSDVNVDNDNHLNIVVIQSLSHVRLFKTPRTTARQASLSFTISQSLFKLMSIESMMSSNHLILCHHLLLPPSVFPSIKVFQISQFFTLGGQSIRDSASASVFPMNIQDWFPLGWTGWISLSPRDSQVSSPTHGSKTSILQHSAFFIVQLSHSYMTTGKTIALIYNSFHI